MTDYKLLLKDWELPEAIMWLLADQPDLMGPTAEHLAERLGVELEKVIATVDDLVNRGLVQFYGRWHPAFPSDADGGDLQISNTVEGSRHLRRLAIERQPRTE